MYIFYTIESRSSPHQTQQHIHRHTHFIRKCNSKVLHKLSISRWFVWKLRCIWIRCTWYVVSVYKWTKSHRLYMHGKMYSVFIYGSNVDCNIMASIKRRYYRLIPPATHKSLHFIPLIDWIWLDLIDWLQVYVDILAKEKTTKRFLLYRLTVKLVKSSGEFGLKFWLFTEGSVIAGFYGIKETTHITLTLSHKITCSQNNWTKTKKQKQNRNCLFRMNSPRDLVMTPRLSIRKMFY